jgi:hypothetical protein
MADSHDTNRRKDSADKLAGRRERGDGRSWRDRYVRSETERLQHSPSDHRSHLSEARQDLARLGRIREQSSLRRLSDFNPERVRKLEDVEIRQNPEGFLRRHAGEGLDAATEREIRKTLHARRGRGRV